MRTAAAEGVVEPHQAAAEQIVVGFVQRADAFDLVDRALLQMVLQIASHAGPVHHDVDAERREPLGRSDAGAMQDLDRADRAGGEDHLALGARLDGLAVLDEAHADGTALLDDQAVDQHMLLEPQVGPLQCGLEEAARRGPAPAALLVDVEITRALVVAGVEIRDALDAHLLCGIADCVENGPGQPRRLDAPAAADTVMLARSKKVVLQSLEHWPHVIIAPAGEPELAPMVVVGGLSPHRDHGVNRRAAADHLAAGIGERAAVQPGLGLGLEHPVRARVADGEEIADGDVEPDPVVVAAGLQNEDAVLRISREPVGDDAAGRAGADDNVVKLTFEPSWHSASTRMAIMPGL